MRATGAPLEGENLDSLHERTEGWPAAVYLAALALQGAGDGPRSWLGGGGRRPRPGG